MARKERTIGANELPDADTLRQLYYVEGKTIREMAVLYHCRTSALIREMDAVGIIRRRRGRAREPLPDWDAGKLRQLVKAKGMPHVRAFAQRRGVNRVKLMALLDERPLARGKHNRHVLVDCDAAIRMAYELGTPVNVLAEQYGCSRRAINYSLDRTSGQQWAVSPNGQPFVAHCFPG